MTMIRDTQMKDLRDCSASRLSWHLTPVDSSRKTSYPSSAACVLFLNAADHVFVCLFLLLHTCIASLSMAGVFLSLDGTHGSATGRPDYHYRAQHWAPGGYERSGTGSRAEP